MMHQEQTADTAPLTDTITAGAGDEVQGSLVVPAIIAVLMPLLMPAVQKVREGDPYVGVHAGASGTLRQ